MSACVNAVDDDDDNDDDKAFLGRPESAKSNGLFAHIGMHSMIMLMITTMIKPSWGDQHRQKAMDGLHKSAFGIKV